MPTRQLPDDQRQALLSVYNWTMGKHKILQPKPPEQRPSADDIDAASLLDLGVPPPPGVIVQNGFELHDGCVPAYLVAAEMHADGFNGDAGLTLLALVTKGLLRRDKAFTYMAGRWKLADGSTLAASVGRSSDEDGYSVAVEVNGVKVLVGSDDDKFDACWHAMTGDGLELSESLLEKTGIPPDVPEIIPTWQPAPGMVGVKTIEQDARYQKDGKNPHRSTIGTWEESHPPPSKEYDPASREVYFPELWVAERFKRWNPRKRNTQA